MQSIELPLESSKIDEVEAFLSTPSEALIQSLQQVKGAVLVLGAGGKMGLHVCLMLQKCAVALDHQFSVTAVSRFKSLNSKDSFEAGGVTTVACDLEDENALNALPDAPNIIYMAGAKFGTNKDPSLLQRMNVELPKKVALRYRNSRILVFSTGCVYSMVRPESGGSRESDPTDPPGDYAQSCLKRELAFSQVAREYGAKVCLLRLNYSTEFRYGVLVDLCQKILAEEPIDLDMGWVNVIWQRDAVDHILRTFTIADETAPPLNITGSGIHAVRDLATRLGKLLDKPVRLTGVEGEAAWLNNASASHELFGLPETSLDQMLKWTASWALNGGQTHGKPTGFEKRSGEF